MFHRKIIENSLLIFSGIQRWLAAPRLDNEPRAHIAALINSVLLMVSGLWLLAIIFQIILGLVVSWTNIWVGLASIAGLLAIRQALRLGFLYFVSTLLPLLGFLSTTVRVWNLGTINTIHSIGYLLVITVSTFLLGARVGFLFLLLTIPTILLIATVEAGRLANPLNLRDQAFTFIFIIFFAFSIITIVRKVMENAWNKAFLEIKQRQHAEDALRRLNASLDQRVSERTRELQAVIEKQHLTEEALRARNKSFSILHRNTLAFLRYRELDELLQSLVDHASELLDSPFAEIVTLEGDELVVRAYSANQTYLAGDRSPRGQALLTWQAVDTRAPAVLEEYSTWPLRRDLFKDAGLHAAAEVPIIIGDGERCLGVLGLARTRPNQPYSPDEIEMARLFTQIAGLAIENIQLQSSLKEQSLRDPLTGLYNRRYLFETLQIELARALRGEYPVSFVLLDIDHFKGLNDVCGHGAGDAVLCALAERLKSLVRAGDILCRYGGDEHMVVLYNTAGPIALARTEQWRQAVEEMVVDYQGQQLQCTLSIGVATFPEHGASIDEVIAHADRALYHSKNYGRNRSTLYAEI